MAGRGRGASQNVPNDLLAQMVVSLQQVNENLHSLNQNTTPSPSSQPLVPPEPAEYRGLGEFCKQKPKQFQGGFAPEAGDEWVQSLERIFRAMGCGDVQLSKNYNDHGYKYLNPPIFNHDTKKCK
ncbi:hypothetical protein Lal_00033278 [Lupinus albus]|nr:hypothetical protein Lal_00033278 [Lupinus albus]